MYACHLIVGVELFTRRLKPATGDILRLQIFDSMAQTGYLLSDAGKTPNQGEPLSGGQGGIDGALKERKREREVGGSPWSP